MPSKTSITQSLFFFFLLCSYFGNSQSCSEHQHDSETQQSEPLLFIPNENQWEPEVKYRVDIGGINKLFMEERALTWLFHDPMAVERMHEDKTGADTMTWQSHAYKVHFVGAAPAKIKGLDQQISYHNYYLGNDPRRWATKVPLFHTVSYDGLYDGIEMKAYSQDGHFKYDFKIAPGVDPAIIKLRYEGIDGLKLTEGHLEIETSVEQVTEQQPYSYQIINAK